MSIPDPLLHKADDMPRQELELMLEKTIGNAAIGRVEHGRFVFPLPAVLVCSGDVVVIAFVELDVALSSVLVCTVGVAGFISFVELDVALTSVLVCTVGVAGFISFVKLDVALSTVDVFSIDIRVVAFVGLDGSVDLSSVSDCLVTVRDVISLIIVARSANVVAAAFVGFGDIDSFAELRAGACIVTVSVVAIENIILVVLTIRLNGEFLVGRDDVLEGSIPVLIVCLAMFEIFS